MIRTLVIAVLIAGSALSLSCNVNQYCLNCAKAKDGGADDAVDSSSGDDSGDSGDGGSCINTGIEVCDGKDNDCDGMVDEGPLPTIGDACPNQVGECAGGVRQCTNGTVTCTKVPKPEQCDGKDNDCNGLTDEGDPGGGAVCGTNVGECTAGTFHCNTTTHVVECQGAIGTVGGQPEQCNNLDDDCDGNFDEGVTSIGPCGGGPGADPNAGACQQGMRVCMGGTFVCVGSIGPTFELCDAIDQDCDGNPTNGYNLTSDPQNCGACGNVCNLSAQHAIAGCGSTPMLVAPHCLVASCNANYFDNDKVVSNGCEYNCGHPITGSETCNGADDDCNGFVDDGLTPPAGLCKNVGACAVGTVESCDGSSGFRCHYNGPDVSTMGGTMNTVITPENLCDGIDNDCDGKIDEGQPNLGQACDNGQIGACRTTGTYVCNSAAPTGPAVCNAGAGPGPQTEVCDGKDNNCNGIVDEQPANFGAFGGQEWISIGNGKEMMRYEASHPDAVPIAPGVTPTPGSSTVSVCSRPDVLPWTNVTYPQAVAACTAIGARLCTEQEWHGACSVIPRTTYPIPTGTGTVSITVEAEDYFANTFKTDGVSAAPANVPHAWIENYIAGYSGISAMEAGPDLGSNLTAAQVVANAPRLDYQFNIQKAATYRVYVLMYSTNLNGNSVAVGLDGGAATLVTQATTTTWQWQLSGTTYVIAAAGLGNHTINIYGAKDGTRIDAIALVDSATTPALPANPKGANWAFASTPNTYTAGVCNDTNLSAANDDVLPTRSLANCRSLTDTNPYDMSGNVKEWTLAHVPGQNPIRGGASNNTGDGISCPLNFTLANDAFFFPNIGFRCCRK